MVNLAKYLDVRKVAGHTQAMPSTQSSSMRDDLIRSILTYSTRKNFELPSLGSEMTSAFELNAKVLNAEPRELEYQIRQDPGMTADIMRLANSPAYRRGNAP